MELMTKEVRMTNGHHNDLYDVRIENRILGRAKAMETISKEVRHRSVTLIMMRIGRTASSTRS